VIQTSLCRGLSVVFNTKKVEKLTSIATKGLNEHLIPLLQQPATEKHAMAVGKAIGMIAPLIGADAATSVATQASDLIGRGGPYTVMGLTAWQGLLRSAVGKGVQYSEILEMCDAVFSALAKPQSPYILLAGFRAGFALAEYGGYAEVGLEPVGKFAQVLKAGAEFLVGGDREHSYIESRGRKCLIALAKVMETPKVQQQLKSVAQQLFAGEDASGGWEDLSECGDEEQEREY